MSENKKTIRIIDPLGRSEKTEFEKREDALNILYRLEGGLSAVSYLMGGSAHKLDYPLDSFEMWILDLKERIADVKDILVEMKFNSK